MSAKTRASSPGGGGRGDYTYLVEIVGANITVYDNQGRVAYGPGVNASTVIQWALDNITTGGKLFIRSGLYLLAIGLIIRRNGILVQGEGCSIVGVTENTVLRLANGANTYVINITSANAIIKDLVVDGNAFNNPAGTYGIYCASPDCWFENVAIMRVRGTGLFIYESYCSALNVFIEDGYGVGLVVGSVGYNSFKYVLSYNNGQHGFQLLKGHDNTFVNCYARGCGNSANNTYDGFRMEGASPYCLRNTFVNCHVSNPNANKLRYGFREDDVNQNYNQVIGGAVFDCVSAQISLQGPNSLSDLEAGYNPQPASTPAVGASPVSFGPYHYATFITVRLGVVSDISIRGHSTGLTSGSFYLYPTDVLVITYTGAPTVELFPE